MVECGAVWAGYQPIWGVEYDPEVSDLHGLNFPDTTLHDWDLTTVHRDRWKVLQIPDILHVSPPCQKFSRCNNLTEGEDDLAIARSITDAIAGLMPKTITIENVRGYENSKSWQTIQSTLYNLGYFIVSGVFNMSDWGVPQDRERFIAIAKRDSLMFSINIPYQTANIADFLSDLIPTFTKSSLTAIQLSKMSDSDRVEIEKIVNSDSDKMALVWRIGIRNTTKVRYGDDSSFTLLASIADHGRGGSGRQDFLNLVYQGKILSLNQRAIARLMGCPDWYKLGSYPNRVVIRGLGNGVCPNFYRQLVSDF